ncbi:MAG TPA: bifunctional 2-polyprenyl-6-hydroxyphenol methylase/3-demethylubiquinol 3-O-methyltransferase UbiG [Brevundimonas sp.]|jgi:2-polyprenyl-6-hydroxyphenyl methylase/3-demethylubiquinone-9 3-methyltransferase|uniref:bifunctional 2-polyprenyl-6-hydroxyphenol methylase/3-demethylubiquinol 3-O-methyltransferase UbiG n=1 Tax=Brevundimonas sp. TaxID=1871086 RepID=UPI002DF1DA8B|nr:bifunctional 2-polyprenyl-6-hydroxyphenol methylase/3-demethylubiquinol 3-O-methyltransferase UbiG [Brevundimonas sp.]
MIGSSDGSGARNPQSEAGTGAAGPSIDPADVARFSAQAAEWWDPKGPFAPLHRFNPSRLAFLRDQFQARFDRRGRGAFTGLTLIDVGCGGGLIAEPMRRLGFEVTGVDASAENVGTARAHADQMGLDIAYRAATAEQIAAEGRTFDVVLALEIVEHVVDPAAFLKTCAGMVAPGGLLVVATLNRTLKSLALGKVMAEYVLRWVPAGTHDWRQFLKPEEIRGMLDGTGLDVTGPFGVAYDPLADRWDQGDDAGVNYFMVGTRG